MTASATVSQANPYEDTEYDIIIVGGGVTGAACARDASMRGLNTLLLERDDFAAGTSSRSSKMIHGGLRYLETYQFHLVREGVREREQSLRIAPHLTHLVPHLYAVYESDAYGLGMLGFALTFYDWFSGQWRKRRHHMLNKDQVLQREPHLNPNGLLGAGAYVDALTDDARFTLSVLRSAVESGAHVLNHSMVTNLIVAGGKVVGVRTKDLAGAEHAYHGRVIVNATGPWTSSLVEQEYGHPTTSLRPSKGVHIVFDKKDFPLRNVIFLRSPDDGRVTWPTPSLEPDRVYVGTTDTDYSGDLDHVEPDESDIAYLLNVANHTIPDAKLDFSHIIGSWAGLRPLVSPPPGTSVGNTSREHRVDIGPAGMITISGGKLTSCRVMGQHVVDQAMKALGLKPINSLASTAPISGGNPEELAMVAHEPASIPGDIWRTWVRRYGANANRLRTLWESDEANQVIIGARHLSVAEINYAIDVEFCATLEDLMVRRTSLFFWDPDGGLREIEAIADLLQARFNWTTQERKRQIDSYAALVQRHRPGRIHQQETP